MSKQTIVIREGIYLPKDQVSMSKVKKNYIKNLYDESKCKICEYKPDRHSFMCDSCPAFKERIVLYGLKSLKGRTYVKLPLGDKRNIERKAGILFQDFKILDKRTLSPFTYPIKFTAKLRPNQEQLVEDFMKHKYGLVVAPPRSGKTITSLYICLELGQRTLVMANQHEFLTQFMDHIHGNEKEGIPKCTNLPELEKKYRKKLYGIPKTDKDFEDFEFLFMTYQSFISEKNGKNRLAKIHKQVGTLFVDEVHKSSATKFASTVSSIRARYRFGCTGTTERKDGKQFIAKAILGPVTSKSTIEALTPTVYIHKTPVEGRKYQPGPAAWVRSMQYLAGHEGRNQLIVDRVVKDLKNSHNIVIPVVFKKHVLVLQSMINKAWGSNICETFMGGGGKKNKDSRKDVLSNAKSGTTRVTVGIRSLLQLGLNVPSWSCLLEVMPISNEPNLRQETARICTPKEGKRPPIIRLFVDQNQPQSAGCARSTIRHMLKFKYHFAQSEKQKELFQEVLSSGSRRQVDQDEFKPHRSSHGRRSDGIVAETIPVKRL